MYVRHRNLSLLTYREIGDSNQNRYKFCSINFVWHWRFSFCSLISVIIFLLHVSWRVKFEPTWKPTLPCSIKVDSWRAMAIGSASDQLWVLSCFILILEIPRSFDQRKHPMGGHFDPLMSLPISPCDFHMYVRGTPLKGSFGDILVENVLF